MVRLLSLALVFAILGSAAEPARSKETLVSEQPTSAVQVTAATLRRMAQAAPKAGAPAAVARPPQPMVSDKVDAELKKLDVAKPVPNPSFVIPKRAASLKSLALKNGDQLSGTLECDGSQRGKDHVTVETSGEHTIITFFCHGRSDRKPRGRPAEDARLSLVLPIKPPAAPAEPPVAPGFTARIDGTPWIAARYLGAPTTIASKPVLNITGMTDNQRFGFNLMLPAAGDYVRTYDLKGGAVTVSSGTFNADTVNANIMENRFPFESGQLTITSFDKAKNTVSGTFSGVAKNGVRNKTIKIDDGKFSDVELENPR
jgi:hypothetical protein